MTCVLPGTELTTTLPPPYGLGRFTRAWALYTGLRALHGLGRFTRACWTSCLQQVGRPVSNKLASCLQQVGRLFCIFLAQLAFCLERIPTAHPTLLILPTDRLSPSSSLFNRARRHPLLFPADTAFHPALLSYTGPAAVSFSFYFLLYPLLLILDPSFFTPCVFLTLYGLGRSTRVGCTSLFEQVGRFSSNKLGVSLRTSWASLYPCC